MIERLRLAIVRNRFSTVVLAHVLLFTAAYYLAFVIRLEGALTLRRVEGPEAFQHQNYGWMFLKTLPFLVAVRLICFGRFDLFRGLWRYVSIRDLLWIVSATTIGTAAFVILVLIVNWLGTGQALTFRGIPRSVFMIEWLLCIVLTGGARLGIRIFREVVAPAMSSSGTRTCIVGAGDAGVMVLREMRMHEHRGYWPICFVDDDTRKLRRKIDGLPVAGTIDEIPQVVSSYGIAEIVIAITKATGEQMERIVKRCEESHARFRVVSAEGEMVRLSRLRPVNIEDLLGRPAARLDEDRIREELAERRLLISGAAGSIGSELVRQCAGYGPAEMTLLDRNENGLFYLEREILDRFPEITLHVVVGDMLDDSTLDRTFTTARPEYVFHAAAFKHVPLMEANPEEAVKNNLLGTKRIAEKSRDEGVRKFVLISTDKAVHPTSVMGATKRAAELMVQSIEPGRTCFTAVRFGNVLGSEGSIVPLFQRQVRAGGPLTVTDENAHRFFMTIPEAVQLVLQAGTMGKGGEVFLLEMGREVRILDVAENLIRLSGCKVADIGIKYIGLRPGEKLREELSIESEGVEPTTHDQIRVLRGEAPPEDTLARIEELIDCARGSDRDDLIRRLASIVPEYDPNNDEFRAILGRDAEEP